MRPRPAPTFKRLAMLLALGAAAPVPALVVMGAAVPAAAQGFQLPSWLGGPPAAPPPQPVPQAPAPAPVPAAPVAPAEPAPPRPVAAKLPSEDSVLGRQLRRNGGEGSLRLERVGREEWRARLTLEGTRISRPGEACTVDLAEPLAVSLRGRPDGLLRLEIAAPSCALTASVLDGALWMRAPTQICAIEASDCRVDPRGLWGPDPAALAPLARTIEQDRGQADRTVRENYRVLSQRAAGPDVRPIVSEQAGFSSERETVCRNYRGEANHGFCNARYTEGRAAQLAARLGLVGTAAAPTAAAAPAPAPAGQPAGAQPRPARPPAAAPLQLGPQAQ